jgi:hypothetical protein
MFEYQLTNGGVLILKDGQPFLNQDRVPGAQGNQPMTEAEAVAYAEAFIAKQTAVEAPVEA